MKEGASFTSVTVTSKPLDCEVQDAQRDRVVPLRVYLPAGDAHESDEALSVEEDALADATAHHESRQHGPQLRQDPGRHDAPDHPQGQPPRELRPGLLRCQCATHHRHEHDEGERADPHLVRLRQRCVGICPGIAEDPEDGGHQCKLHHACRRTETVRFDGQRAQAGMLESNAAPGASGGEGGQPGTDLCTKRSELVAGAVHRACPM